MPVLSPFKRGRLGQPIPPENLHALKRLDGIGIVMETGRRLIGMSGRPKVSSKVCVLSTSVFTEKGHESTDLSRVV